jgi:hypothetical protein
MALLPLLRHDHDIGPGAGLSPAALVEVASVDVPPLFWLFLPPFAELHARREEGE